MEARPHVVAFGLVARVERLGALDREGLKGERRHAAAYLHANAVLLGQRAHPLRILQAVEAHEEVDDDLDQRARMAGDDRE